MLKPLAAAIWEIMPDLTAVSGDLTQRARAREFREARVFLESLPVPHIIVPGNHDVPLYNPFFRFLLPLARFTRYISSNLSPLYVDDEIAVLGANTTRSLVAKGGRINIGQVDNICRQFSLLRKEQIKIIVTHHPFDLPEGFSNINLVGRSRMAMENFAECGVDLFLSGHLHLALTGNTARYRIPGFSALVITAGTVVSTRGRGELNSFNLIRIALPDLSIETYAWNPYLKRFLPSGIQHFRESKNEEGKRSFPRNL